MPPLAGDRARRTGRRHGQSQLLELLDPLSLDELEPPLSLPPQLLPEQWLLWDGSWLRRRQSSSLS